MKFLHDNFFLCGSELTSNEADVRCPHACKDINNEIEALTKARAEIQVQPCTTERSGVSRLSSYVIPMSWSYSDDFQFPSPKRVRSVTSVFWRVGTESDTFSDEVLCESFMSKYSVFRALAVTVSALDDPFFTP